MKHNLKISVSKKQNPGGLVNCRSVTVRERILRFFLGTPQRMMMLVPGDSIVLIILRTLQVIHFLCQM